jgi:hypothetical protein
MDPQKNHSLFGVSVSDAELKPIGGGYIRKLSKKNERWYFYD